MICRFVVAWLLLVPCGSAGAGDFGEFRGPLVYRGLADRERIVELVAPFSFRDSKGKVWFVPTRARVDGASIPQVFWSVIGGPFTGKHREASVVHDYYCDIKTEPWKETHRVFYDGIRANGVDILTANRMYAAVYRFGPRWTKIRSTVVFGRPLPEDFDARVRNIGPGKMGHRSLDLEELARRPNISAEEISAAVDRALEVTPEDAPRILGTLPDCSITVEPLGQKGRGSEGSVLCNLNEQSRRLLAQRNLAILTSDVKILLSANSRFLIPMIDEYIASPTMEHWKNVRASSEEVLNLINLTMLSLVQYDGALKIDSKEPGEFTVTLMPLAKTIKKRSIMLPQTRKSLPPTDVDEMRAWKRVYLEVLARLDKELVPLELKLAEG